MFPRERINTRTGSSRADYEADARRNEIDFLQNACPLKLHVPELRIARNPATLAS